MESSAERSGMPVPGKVGELLGWGAASRLALGAVGRKSPQKDIAA